MIEPYDEDDGECTHGLDGDTEVREAPMVCPLCKSAILPSELNHPVMTSLNEGENLVIFLHYKCHAQAKAQDVVNAVLEIKYDTMLSILEEEEINKC